MDEETQERLKNLFLPPPPPKPPFPTPLELLFGDRFIRWGYDKVKKEVLKARDIDPDMDLSILHPNERKDIEKDIGRVMEVIENDRIVYYPTVDWKAIEHAEGGIKSRKYRLYTDYDKAEEVAKIEEEQCRERHSKEKLKELTEKGLEEMVEERKKEVGDNIDNCNGILLHINLPSDDKFVSRIISEQPIRIPKDWITKKTYVG